MAFTTKSSSKAKKELTPKQQTVRTVLNWIVNILCIVLIIFALIVAIFTIIRSTNPDNITRVGDNCYFNVASDSMEPTFSTHDVIIAKAYEGDGSDLKVGQVITFKFVRYYDGTGYEEFNSHRIIHINYNTSGKVESFSTRGDNQEGNWKDALEDSSSWDARRVVASDIVATWGSVDENGNFTSGKMLKGAGALANFMQHPVHGKTRFFCIVVLPLILLFVIYAFILVRALIISKLEKDKKVAGETAISLETMTEEEKQQLMQQLLASQNASAVNNGATDGNDTESGDKTDTADTTSIADNADAKNTVDAKGTADTVADDTEKK